MFVTHRNCKIHYTSTGEGPTLLLLHGFLETLNMWDDFVEELSENNHVLCIDLLGHGKTECLGYIHSMEAMAEAVYSVIEELKIIEVSCVGHSMGGYVALALAETKPNLIKNLCLMNSTYEADDNERMIMRARAAQMATENYEALVRMSFTNLFAPNSKEKFKDDFDKALVIGLKTSKQGFIAAHKGMAIRPNRFETFTDITGVKTIIIGEKDTIYNQELIMQKVKNTRIKIELFSGGHMSHIENKSDLSYIIIHFVEK